jgi:hypothetical protein
MQARYSECTSNCYMIELFCRGEKSLTLSLPLVQALDGITLPFKAISDLRNDVIQLGQKIDSISTK